MRQFAFSMSGWTVRRTKSISRLILDRLNSWWRNTALEAIRVVCNYDYRFAAGVAMWAIRSRWHRLKMRMPAYRQLAEWQSAYWEMHDRWSDADLEYRNLYVKHLDLLDEVRYWETRHAKIMNYVEKKMELDDTWGK